MEPRWVDYDEKGDILYLWSRRPEDVDSIISEETGEDILIEKDGDTGEVIGVTIMHLSKRDAMEGIPAPAPA